MTRKQKIQEELKLLEWHKLANDAAIKAALFAEQDIEGRNRQMWSQYIARTMLDG